MNGAPLRRVVLESPYAAPTPEGIAENVRYARRALRDCLLRGDAPIASHLLFTQEEVLNDANQAERSLGMRAGFAWTAVAEAVVVYTDRGISPGMRAGIARAAKHGKPVEYRTIDEEVVAVNDVTSGAAVDGEDLSPALLASLFLTIGLDVTAAQIAAACETEADAEAARAWAHTMHMRAQGIAQGEKAEIPPLCPDWVRALIKAQRRTPKEP